jgi:hypothetical protein
MLQCLGAAPLGARKAFVEQRFLCSVRGVMCTTAGEATENSSAVRNSPAGNF